MIGSAPRSNPARPAAATSDEITRVILRPRHPVAAPVGVLNVDVTAGVIETKMATTCSRRPISHHLGTPIRWLRTTLLYCGPAMRICAGWPR